MNLDKAFVADIETDGLLDELTKLHVLSVGYFDSKAKKWKIKSTKEKEDVIRLFSDPENTIVGHNFISFDIPAIELLYPDFEIQASIIDTLPLSYYLYSERDGHGLEKWGEHFGVPKPEIEDWVGLSYEEYRHRCEEDVKINVNLWVKILAYLRAIYDNDDEAIIKVINYFNFKAEELYIQQENKVLIDRPQAQENLDFLQAIIDEKTEELAAIMPKVPIKAKRKYPAKPYKKDESLSATGIRWFTLLKEQGLPDDHKDDITVITGYEEPNPGSNKQMKEFLFSKGWKPRLFEPGANGPVPQLRDKEKELCESIKILIKDNPELEALDGLSVAQHRAGYLKSFLEKSDEKGYVAAWAHGFTRTLRLKHVAPFVNLPKPNAHHGELVRSCMIAPEGYVCIGADLSSIEDKCKQISIYDLDPEYVESMNTKGWDAHLALGLIAGMFTQDEVDFYKWYKTKPKLKKGEENPYTLPESFSGLSEDEMYEAFELLDKKRAKAKTSNYACTYGAGAKKLSEGDMTLPEAKELHKGYWKLNWSVKKFAETRIVKEVKGHNWLRLSKKAGGIKEVNTSKWIWNEYSKLWLYLKNDKDRFSACNQNFGVKVFDTWGYFLIKAGIKPIFQAHDEFLWYCKKEDVEAHKKILDESVIKLNKAFNPVVPLEIDYKIGDNYSQVH